MSDGVSPILAIIGFIIAAIWVVFPIVAICQLAEILKAVRELKPHPEAKKPEPAPSTSKPSPVTKKEQRSVYRLP